MATRKFLTSVGDAYFYDTNDVLLFSSKTLLNSDMEVTLASSEVRGGRGNSLLYTYFHTGALNITLSETQFNLNMLGNTVGSGVTTGNNVYTEETITLGASGTGTVLGTPLAIQGATLYGWVTQNDGTIERVTFSGKTFATSSGASGDIVCVRYYAADAASRSITIPANAIPKIGRLVIEAQLCSSDESTNKIGIVQIVVPKFSLSGAFTLTMASDGVSQTPLTGFAYAYSDATTTACTSEPVYATIYEILDNANAWDGVIALAIEGGNFALKHPASRTLVVYAIRSGDDPFIISNSLLDFTSGTAGTATIGLHTGAVSTVAAGTTLLTAAITAVPTIEASCTLTVS